MDKGVAVQGLLIIVPTIKSLENKIKSLSICFKTKMQKEVKKLVL